MERLRLKLWLIVVLLLLSVYGTKSPAEPMGTAFTYQGRLTDANQPANGLYDFQFKLFDAPTAGNQQGPTQSFFDVFLEAGYFTVELDFVGGASGGPEPLPLSLDYLKIWGSGEARWLEIAVRPAIVPQLAESIQDYSLTAFPEPLPLVYTILSPRQKITPAPYALHALSSGTGPGPGPMVGGSGTDNYIPRWRGTSDLEDSVIYQTDTGNVGIGTTTPGRKLDVESAEDGQIEVRGTDPSKYGGLVLYNDRFAGIVGVGGSNNPNADIRHDLFLRTPGDCDIVFQTGNTTLAIIKTGGNVGIGTTTPGAKLEVAGQVKITGGSPGAGKVLTSDATGLASWQPAGGGLPSGTSGQTLRHDGTNWVANSLLFNNGTKVGIGSTNPARKLSVLGDGIHLDASPGNPELVMVSEGGVSIFLRPFSPLGPSGGHLEITNNAASEQYMSITKYRVGIGMTTPTEKLDVDGTARFRGISVGTGTTVVVDGNGKLFKSGPSSIRYKTNIQDLESDPDKILELRPVRFQWKTTGQDEIGLIAEEVEGIAKDLIVYDQEGKADAVKYDKVALYLLSVVKAQQQRIAALEAKQAENRSLTERIEALELMLQQQNFTAKEVLQ